MVSMMIVNSGPFSQYHFAVGVCDDGSEEGVLLIQQLFTASADGGDGDDGGEHKSLPFWSIFLDDHWSKKIYRPKMIV